MEIRKISIGPDYKSGAMHYILGQEVLGGSHTIHLIQATDEDGLKVWLINDKEEVLLWKSFTPTMPVSIEYNIYF
tara:strand:+ start:1192 stop:1416 length:225 start_codon:yes stop_codon:yes gene_type:complete